MAGIRDITVPHDGECFVGQGAELFSEADTTIRHDVGMYALVPLIEICHDCPKLGDCTAMLTSRTVQEDLAMAHGITTVFAGEIFAS